MGEESVQCNRYSNEHHENEGESYNTKHPLKSSILSQCMGLLIM